MFDMGIIINTPVVKITIIYLAPDLAPLTGKVDTIMATQAELAQQLRDLKAQNDKADAEQKAALAALQAALAAAGGTTPEVDAAMLDLAASIQRDDDENPDAPPAP